MEDVIFWEGPGYYYPSQTKSFDGNWFTIWSYRSDNGEQLSGMGTPQYFGEVPTGFQVNIPDLQYFKRRVRDTLNKSNDDTVIARIGQLLGIYPR